MKSFIVILIWCLCFQNLHGQLAQTWKSPSGHRFEGVFVRMENQVVTLRGTDHKEINVPLSALDAGSQKQAMDAQAELVKNAPVFTHQNRHLRFSLSPKSEWLNVEFLHGSNLINNESYDLSIRFAEIRSNNDWYETPVKEVYGNIEKTRENVTMRLLMENGVVLKFIVDLDDKAELTYEFSVDEVPEGLPKLDFRVAFSSPKLLSYDINTQTYEDALSKTSIKYEGLKDYFQGYELRVDGYNDTTSKVYYYEKQTQEFRGKVITVKVPGKKDLKLEGPKNPDNGSLYIWFYSGKAPFEGYNIIAHSQARSNLSAGPFSISVK